MTADESLLSPNDVRLNSMVGAQIDANQLSSLIIVTEETLFNAHFGRAFYDALLADVAAYTYTPFSLGVNYLIGSYVLANSLIYEVIQTTTGVQIPAQNNAYFRLAPKFVTPANEFLWLRYLKRLLATAVANEASVTMSMKLTEKGVIRLKDETFDAVKTQELAMYREHNYQHIKQSISVMERYILDNAADYPTYKPIADKADNTCLNIDTAAKYRRNTYGIVFPTDDDCNDCKINTF